tara:strand:+ start:20566 stop:21288 length:723 start_codon:yes stop_codon:yes gene_type:complete
MFRYATPAVWPEALGGELPTISYRDADGLRLYKHPYKDVEFPSVTTVLSNYEKEGLIEWQKRVGEETANRIKRKAADRGSAYHKILEEYILGEDYSKNNHSAETVVMFKDTKLLLDKYIDNIHCTEQTMYSDFLEVAGTGDLIAEWSGILSIIDFKTSLRTKKKEWVKSYFMQESAYAVMYEEMTGLPVSQLVTLMYCYDELSPYGIPPKIQIFVEKRDNHIQDFIAEKNRWFQNLGTTK